MTIIHGFTSFNTIAAASENCAFINGDAGADKGVRADAADWSRWKLARFSACFSIGQRYRVEDCCWGAFRS